MGKNAKRRREAKGAHLKLPDGRRITLDDFFNKRHIGDKPANLAKLSPPTVARLADSGGTPRQIWEGQLVHYLWYIEDLDFPDVVHVLRAEYGLTIRDTMWACRWGMPSGVLALPIQMRNAWLGTTAEGDSAAAPLGELLDALISCDSSCDAVAALLACGTIGVDLPEALYACYWTVPLTWQALRSAVGRLASMADRDGFEPMFISAAMPKSWARQLRKPEAAFMAAGISRAEYRQLEHRPAVSRPGDVRIHRATPGQVAVAWASFQEAALLHEHARTRWNELAQDTNDGQPVATSERRSVLEIGLEAAKEYATVVDAVQAARLRYEFAVTTAPLPVGRSFVPRGAHPPRPAAHGPQTIRNDWSMPEVYSRLADAWGLVSTCAVTLGDQDLGVRAARLALSAAEHSCSDYDVGRRAAHLATCLLLGGTRDAASEAHSALKAAEQRFVRAGAQQALATTRSQRAHWKRFDANVAREQMGALPLPPSTGFGIGRLPPL